MEENLNPNEEVTSDSQAKQNDIGKFGYQSVISLLNNESQVIWRSFQALIAANTLLLGTAAVLKSFLKAPNFYGIVLSAIGMLICASWFIIQLRQWSYHDKYVKLACDFENKYFNSQINLFNKKSDKITIFRVRNLAFSIIFVIFLIYLAMLFLSIKSSSNPENQQNKIIVIKMSKVHFH